MHFASRADVVLVYQDELSMNEESGPPINVPLLLTVFCTRDRVERDDTKTTDSHDQMIKASLQPTIFSFFLSNHSLKYHDLAKRKKEAEPQTHLSLPPAT